VKFREMEMRIYKMVVRVKSHFDMGVSIIGFAVASGPNLMVWKV